MLWDKNVAGLYGLSWPCNFLLFVVELVIPVWDGICWLCYVVLLDYLILSELFLFFVLFCFFVLFVVIPNNN